MTIALSRPRTLACCSPHFLPPGAAAILTLPGRGCRWPIGEVEEDGFRFCAEPCGPKSYCPRHARQRRRGAR